MEFVSAAAGEGEFDVAVAVVGESVVAGGHGGGEREGLLLWWFGECWWLSQRMECCPLLRSMRAGEKSCALLCSR